MNESNGGCKTMLRHVACGIYIYTGFVACTLAYGREKWVESLEPCREILEPSLFLIVIS